MAHVTFIHGISNKPPADDLLRIWGEAMANAAEPLPLGDLGVTSSMVYWADLLYEKAEEDLSAYEGVLENTAEAIDGGGDAPPPVPRTAEEAAFLDGLRAKMTALSEAELEVGRAAAGTGPAARCARARAAALVHQEALPQRLSARRAPLPVRRRVRPARQAAGADPADDPQALCRCGLPELTSADHMSSSRTAWAR